MTTINPQVADGIHNPESLSGTLCMLSHHSSLTAKRSNDLHSSLPGAYWQHVVCGQRCGFAFCRSFEPSSVLLFYSFFLSLYPISSYHFSYFTFLPICGCIGMSGLLQVAYSYDPTNSQLTD
ncbi:hypothetical protein H112_06336 [Trichophyton rubrum D6]|uniref:Uncharacterized protein n=3 Tax=Trichophyton TaxID=5550 RepID=A0A080WR81_TRIRC|nr:uncharacterized protein TERG_11750 [Trichophyton rubrum CBS 118892]EZF13189.1 hypothetical protein H100_06351 [Trichophyton rubrum MR850]EZF39718.1 hypothetical protein H102_06317 [Trichophyton rubrum CBS 100081]EZF50243.1 hypothetical protein H103_06343 [Trichophyton rubrum CBS 288.86]EZF60874.1 hypothetical protein H104_06329 [Trichophyton rubrum CBS 289.86]EZF71391.1 hypothetical protein H105_06356 [Trichophyton soudanense CBS 452.61]EZF82201.1 hypothetical protein H110_06339 [Trichophy